jgi:hypothetical protein
MGEITGRYRLLVGKMNRRDRLENLGVGWDYIRLYLEGIAYKSMDWIH